MRGQIPIRHFIFHRKAKLGSYRAETGRAPAGTLPPQAKVLYERLYHRGGDPETASFVSVYGSRVPFVFSQVAGGADVPFGAPGAGSRGGSRLIDTATSPDNVWGGRRDYKEMQMLLRGTIYPSLPPLPLVLQEEEEQLQWQLLQQQQHPVMQLHYRYYITKQIIPALDRLFSLLPPPASADLLQWFKDMPKPAQRIYAPLSHSTPVQQQQRLQQRQQQTLLQQLGIKSITGADSVGERLVLQRFFAAASCLLCGSRCKELGPTPLTSYDSSMKGILNPRNTRNAKKRKFTPNIKPEEAQEIAVRQSLLQHLHQAGFSDSSSTSSIEEEDGRTAEDLYKGRKRVKRIDVSKERVVIPPPICKECSSNPAVVCVRMHQRLKKVEQRIAAARSFCRHCAGSRVYAEACLHSWHCDVYFRRISEADKLRVVQEQMQNMGLFIDT